MRNRMGCAVMFYLAAVFIPNPVFALEWQLDSLSSHLVFVFEEAGSDAKGEFKKFDATFKFDPNKLEESHFSATIQTSSLLTNDKDRDEILRSSDMFHVSKWPEAHFQTLKIMRKGGNNYEALARLMIRDVSKEIKFPFTLEIIQNKEKTFFHMQSSTVISRLQFGVGQGDWSDPTWIGDEVNVHVDVYATKK